MADAPPSYSEATGLPTSRYLTCREPLTESVFQSLQDIHSEVLSHSIEPCPTLTSPTPFPSPEAAWLARDIDRDDWAALNEELSLANKATDPSEKIAHLTRVANEWNTFFFSERACRIDIPEIQGNMTAVQRADVRSTRGQTAAQPAAALTAAITHQPPVSDPEAGSDVNGLGFRVGGSFVGVGVAKENSGFGLKFGDMIIGVSNGPLKR